MQNPKHMFLTPTPENTVKDFVVVPVAEEVENCPLYASLDLDQIFFFQKHKDIFHSPHYTRSACVVATTEQLLFALDMPDMSFIWLVYNKTFTLPVVAFRLDTMINPSNGARRMMVKITLDYSTLEGFWRFPQRFKSLEFPLMESVDQDTYHLIANLLRKKPEYLSLTFTQRPDSKIVSGSSHEALEQMSSYRKTSFSSLRGKR